MTARNATRRVKRLRQEADSLSAHVASTYDEISLLYRLTQNLKLSKSNENLGRIALHWTKEVLPAAGLLLQLASASGGKESLHHAAASQPVFLSIGECPIDGAAFADLIAHLGPQAQRQPMLIDRSVTAQPDWPYPQIHEMIVVALCDGGRIFGWLAALNHTQGGEFGRVEASLLGSVAAVLAIHGGNVELYRHRSELLAEIVRALTAAVDAKDPYTCGHSDRVARVAVRLAEELGCDAEMIDNLYLAGLLHDIGKIGIDDTVLRKAGTLSDEEYEHIKAHVSIGHRILHDLVKLEDVLPVVLHHHESWDGGGYPHHLDSCRIPLPARIVAVADAFDAMSSDRPYRKAMPDENGRPHSGNGSRPPVGSRGGRAFFRAREDIRRMCRDQRRPVDLGLTRFSPLARQTIRPQSAGRPRRGDRSGPPASGCQRCNPTASGSAAAPETDRSTIVPCRWPRDTRRHVRRLHPLRFGHGKLSPGERLARAAAVQIEKQRGPERPRRRGLPHSPGPPASRPILRRAGRRATRARPTAESWPEACGPPAPRLRFHKPRARSSADIGGARRDTGSSPAARPAPRRPTAGNDRGVPGACAACADPFAEHHSEFQIVHVVVGNPAQLVPGRSGQGRLAVDVYVQRPPSRPQHVLAATQFHAARRIRINDGQPRAEGDQSGRSTAVAAHSE